MFKQIYHRILILFSGLFDRKYYLNRYKDVKRAKANPLTHYLRYGWKEGRNPSEKFDTKYYLENNPDVRKSKANPLIHYIKNGRKESRRAVPPGKNIHLSEGIASIKTIRIKRE